MLIINCYFGGHVMVHVINAENLNMNFGPIQAVQNISFQINQGEVVGLLGPNGAGKTTTLRILTSYLTPTSGHVKIFEQDLQDHLILSRKKIGYLPENAPLYPDMEVKEYLIFVGKSRDLQGRELQTRIDQVQEDCHIKPVMRQRIFELSKGFKQRVGLAQALIHDPEILILDEPTSGLDPLQILGIRDLIHQLAQTKTILFSTHVLQEASAVTNRILIIHNGKLIADGSIKELAQKAHSKSKVFITVDASQSDIENELMKLEFFENSNIIETNQKTTSFCVEYSHDTPIIDQLDLLIKNKKWPLKQFFQKEPTLEEIFIAMTQDSNSKRIH